MRKHLFSLLFLFFLGITFGENYCIDDSFNASLVVKNTYSSNEYFTVAYTATPGLIISFDDPLDLGFFMPGEEKTIGYDISMPFKGNYSLTFEITDSKANKETRTFNFEVSYCHNVEIKVLSIDNYCLRQNAPYQVIITNTGRYAENLSININNEVFYPELLAGQSKTYNLEFYSVFLENNLISINVDNEFIHKSIQETVNVRNCDKTGIILDQIKTCPGQLINSKLTIKNLGYSSDAYQIINSSSNVLIEPELLFVDSRSEDFLTFSIVPACDELGLKRGEINLYSRNSGYIKAVISYEVMNCYDFEIMESNSFSELCEQDQKTLSFALKNKGLVPDSYSGVLKFGNESVNLNFYLKDKETANFNITEHFDYSGKTSAELILSSNNFCGKTKTVNYNLTVKPFKECYSANVELEKLFRSHSSVKITNNGSRANEYFVSVYNYSEISNMSFVLNPFESRELQLSSLNEIMNDYEISVFSVNVLAKGVNITSQTSYANTITGMIILSVKEYYSYLGLILFLGLSALFIKNNLLKSRKSNIKA